MKRSLTVLAAFALALGTMLSAPLQVRAASQPSVAVMSFDSTGLDSTAWWDTSFQPGAALADLVTDQLVNKGGLTVVDRQHLGTVLQEHSLSTSGEVSPATAVQAGRLIGAKFLIVGRIVQFQQVSNNAANAGSIIGHGLGLGSVSSHKVNLNVAVHVIDATSGQIVQAFNAELSKSGTSFGVEGAGWSNNAVGFGGYSSTQFVNSTMGKLINEEAQKISETIDPNKMVAGPAAPTLNGRVVGISGGDIILNIGSAKGVQVGQFFDVMKIVKVKDPDSGNWITSRIPKGKIQVTSVDTSSCVAKKVGSADVAVGSSVSSE